MRTSTPYWPCSACSPGPVGAAGQLVGQVVDGGRDLELGGQPGEGDVELHRADGGQHRCLLDPVGRAQHLDHAFGVELADAAAGGYPDRTTPEPGQAQT